MPKGKYDRKKTRLPKHEPKEIAELIHIKPEDMRIIDGMTKTLGTPTTRIAEEEALHKIFGMAEECRLYGSKWNLIADRLSDFMAREKIGDAKLAFQKLVTAYEADECGKSPETETLMAFIAKHNLAHDSPVMALNGLIEFYEMNINDEHSQVQRVFDFNMDDLEWIMNEYHCTFNEALSLLISTFRRNVQLGCKVSESTVPKA